MSKLLHLARGSEGPVMLLLFPEWGGKGSNISSNSDLHVFASALLPPGLCRSGVGKLFDWWGPNGL